MSYRDTTGLIIDKAEDVLKRLSALGTMRFKS